MNLCERTGARLGAAGLVCALAVVLIHCQSMRVWFSGEASDFGINGICDERLDVAIRFFLSYTFVRTAVPFFFVITGFFLARSGNGWLENIKKRALSLYIPFVIWNAANVALNVCAGRLSDEGSLVLAEKIFGWNTMSRLGCMQFWYIQAVFVFLLLWPAVSMLMRNRWTAVALFSVLFAGWIGMYRYHLGQAMQAGNFLWMCCGAAAGMYSVNTREWPQLFGRLWVKRVPFMVFAISIVAKVWMGIAREQFWFDVADRVLILSGLAAIFLNLEMFDFVVRRFKSLIGLSFFIYAFHTIAITLAVQFGGKVGLYGLTLYLFKICFALTFTVGVGLMARKCLPRVFCLVTGGRR